MFYYTIHTTRVFWSHSRSINQLLSYNSILLCRHHRNCIYIYIYTYNTWCCAASATSLYTDVYNIHQSSHWRLIILHRHSAVNQNPYTYTSIIVRNENIIIIIIIKLYRGKNMCFCRLRRDALYRYRIMVLRVHATAY